MFNDDFILRQIELMIKGVAQVFKKEIKEDGEAMETRSAGGVDNLTTKLFDLVDENKLGEAEDVLFAYAEENPTTEVFGVAVEFYKMLDDLSDEDLSRADFSRSEISKGLNELLKIINSYV